MTASDLAVVLVTIVAIAALVVLAVAAWSLLRTLRELRATLARVREDTLPVLADLRQTAVDAGVEVERIDGLLDAAESITATVEGASRLGYVAFRRPLVKMVALFRGVGHGLWRLVGGGRARAGRPSRTNGPAELDARRKRRAA